MHLVAKEYSFITPQALGKVYKKFCKQVGLRGNPIGYGLVHVVDKDDGDKHYTMVTSDVDYVRSFIGKGMPEGFQVPPGKFKLRREGWPDEWIKGH